MAIPVNHPGFTGRRRPSLPRLAGVHALSAGCSTPSAMWRFQWRLDQPSSPHRDRC